MKKFSREIREFLLLQRTGTLSTLSASSEGYPFGSLVPYDLDSSGQFIIYISLIAEHYKNLVRDSRASLLVIDEFATGDRQAYARATVLLNFTEVPAAEQEAVQKSYEQRFPAAVNHEIAHNFRFFRGAPQRLRWIGGFGEIAWLRPEDYFSVPHDAIAYQGIPVLEHMNADHPEALRDYVRAFSPHDPEKFSSLRMTHISSRGFEITLGEGADRKIAVIPFPQPLTQSSDIRLEMIALLKKARKS